MDVCGIYNGVVNRSLAWPFQEVRAKVVNIVACLQQSWRISSVVELPAVNRMVNGSNPLFSYVSSDSSSGRELSR